MDFKFDGFEDWEKEVQAAIDEIFPQEIEKFVKNQAKKLKRKAIEKTPVGETGHLHQNDNWQIGAAEKRGDEYYIEVSNNIEYAEHVEYGHRTRYGMQISEGTAVLEEGKKMFVEGAHMVELSEIEVQKELPMAERRFLNQFLKKAFKD